VDFQLPVGPADRWVTAYVAFALAEAGSLGAGALQSEACRWLEQNRGPEGWGYNAGTPDDADSTSLASLALRAAGRPAAPETLDFLRRCSRENGGVSTYPPGTSPGGAWCESAPDVTPVCVAARGFDASWRTALDWLLETQRPDGFWNSYWWTTPLYTGWWVMRVFGASMPKIHRAKLVDAAKSLPVQGAFEQALRILLLSEAGEPVSAHGLIALQNPDGSWPASAWLRLARPEIADPWRRIDSGACFLDHGRVFTTATALLAVAATLRRGPWPDCR
jgi:hypothetical protein